LRRSGRDGDEHGQQTERANRSAAPGPSFDLHDLPQWQAGSGPLATMPPRLLARLPRLPDSVEYQLVGRQMILRDNLVMEVLPDAVPPARRRENSPMRRLLLAALVVLLWLPAAGQQPAALPQLADAVRFAVIGDNGTGDRPEYEVGAQLATARAAFPFTFVIMMGDNMYGSERPQDFERKFMLPYKPLLDAGVGFYATLGNHDGSDQRFYKPYHMNGERYYTFSRGPVAFFVLDSNDMDPKQIGWLTRQLDGSQARWKICYFHHPLYSSGATHGSATHLRALIEPVLVQGGVDVVFSGHEHFYERIRPQKGITYFISGAAGKLRKGDIRPSPLLAAGFSADRSFMLIKIAGDDMYFQAVSRTGRVVDSGNIGRRAASISNPGR
jgi:hypothetical protein